MYTTLQGTYIWRRERNRGETEGYRRDRGVKGESGDKGRRPRETEGDGETGRYRE